MTPEPIVSPDGAPDAARPGRGPLPTPLRAPGEPEAPTVPVLDLPRRRIDLSRRVAVMGIVNRTPDSFYDRGATYAFDTALAHARRLVAEGADIIDVGGVKGGPGDAVSVDEEIDRVVPFVEALRAVEPDVLLSVDTFRAPVAAAAMAAISSIPGAIRMSRPSRAGPSSTG